MLRRGYKGFKTVATEQSTSAPPEAAAAEPRGRIRTETSLPTSSQVGRSKKRI